MVENDKSWTGLPKALKQCESANIQRKTFEKAEEIFLKTILINYTKACLGEFRLCCLICCIPGMFAPASCLPSRM